MLDNKRRNEVKSITKKRGKLTLEFFDNDGKVRQKDTGLEPTKANRQKLYKLVPEFEERLEEQAQQKEALSFGYYADLFLVLKKDTSKYKQYQGYVKRFKSYFGEDTPQRTSSLRRGRSSLLILQKGMVSG